MQLKYELVLDKGGNSNTDTNAIYQTPYKRRKMGTKHMDVDTT